MLREYNLSWLFSTGYENYTEYESFSAEESAEVLGLVASLQARPYLPFYNIFLHNSNPLVLELLYGGRNS